MPARTTPNRLSSCAMPRLAAAFALTSVLACGHASSEVPSRDGVLHVVDTSLAETDERFLAVALDTAQVVGSTWWNPSGDVEGAGGTAPVAQYDFTRPRLRRLARELAPTYLRVGGS